MFPNKFDETGKDFPEDLSGLLCVGKDYIVVDIGVSVVVVIGVGVVFVVGVFVVVFAGVGVVFAVVSVFVIVVGVVFAFNGLLFFPT